MNIAEFRQSRLPLLTRWMRSATTEHPLYYDLNEDTLPWGGYHWAYLDQIESILSRLTAAQPRGLDEKRKVFGSINTRDGWRGLVSEMTFAARLIRSGIAFDFGERGTPMPDLVLRDLRFGVEITSRKSDATWDLQRRVAHELLLHRRPQRPTLSMEFSSRPYAIRRKVQDQIVEELRRAIESRDEVVHCVVRPASQGVPAVKLTIYLTWPQRRSFSSMWPTVRIIDPYTVDHLVTDVATALERAMTDTRKSRQAAAMPALLIVNIADVRGVQTRQGDQWGNLLVNLLRPNHRFAGLGVTPMAAWQPEARLYVGENPFARDCDLNELRAFERMLGLPRLILGAAPPELPTCGHNGAPVN